MKNVQKYCNSLMMMFLTHGAGQGGGGEEREVTVY